MTAAVDIPASVLEQEPEDALGRLEGLARAGRLADLYAAVPPLLAEIAADGGLAGLARAGRVLGRVDADEAEHAHPSLGRVRVAVAAHSTVAALVPPLTAELARHGLLLDVTVGDHDGYVRELRVLDSLLYAPGLDLGLVVLDAQAVLEDLPEVWRVEDAQRVAKAKLAQLETLARRYAEHSAATLVFNTVPLQRAYTHQLVDLKSRAALGVVWREFNVGLLKLAAKFDRLVVLDLDPLVAEGGPVGDARSAAYARARFGDELLGRYAREVAHLARALKGRSKKALVLDLDDTLWDGALAAGGPDGVAAAATCRGEAFGAFQRVAKQIGAQGVLLAASGKSDPEPVLRVLREHPDMRLRERDFARVSANWAPKDVNLRELAARLNLGVRDLVFADDSPLEADLVAASLPAVAVVRLDGEPARHAERLLADGWFDVLELTAEDRRRAELHRSDTARRGLLEEAGSPEEYLARLEVEVSLAPVREADVARVARLTADVGRFNLTALRMTEAEVRSRAQDPGQYTLCIRCADRFGDEGVVGAVFARIGEDGLRIDNMLVSARVSDRGVERAAAAALLAHAREARLGPVWAGYRAAAHNHPARGFWPSVGFAAAGAAAGADALEFRHDLAELPAVPAHLTLQTGFGR